MSERIKRILQYIILLAAIPIVIIVGATMFKGRQYAFITLMVVILACIPFFMSFERDKENGRLLIIIAVMVAMSSVGRVIFVALPGFKPVTAMVVITAAYFGPQAGFMTGALTAVISNFYFGQGPWTPFQMFSWGLMGFIAGLLHKHLLKNTILLAAYGVFAGIAYSMLMDTWTVIWWDGDFNVERYVAAIIAALPPMAVYAISNVIFLMVFKKPIGQILERIKYKYGL